MALFFKIVPQYQRVIRFTLGQVKEQPRGPGWVWMIPFVHQATTVDLREEVFDVEPQMCITKDNAPVTIDMLVFMRVVNPEDSILKVQSYRAAARGMAITTLRAVVGDLVLDDVLAKREHINSVMQVRMDEVTDRWGVKVNAVEIREILPPRDIQDAMSRQMSAERIRRAIVTEADGNREAAILNAQGQQQSLILNAEGSRQAAVLQADGQKQAAILNAEGYSAALDRIFSVARGIDQKTMVLQYLDMMRALAQGPGTRWVIPMELTSFVQNITRGVADGALPREEPSAAPAAPQTPASPPPAQPET